MSKKRIAKDDRKELTPKQAAVLFEAARAWKSQGAESKWTTGPSKYLWVVIDKLEKLTERKLHVGDDPPKVGADIYVGSRYYIDRGEDDVCGGRVEVVKSAWDTTYGRHRVEVREIPNQGYFWDVLQESQKKWKKEFGDERGHPCPDRG